MFRDPTALVARGRAVPACQASMPPVVVPDGDHVQLLKSATGLILCNLLTGEECPLDGAAKLKRNDEGCAWVTCGNQKFWVHEKLVHVLVRGEGGALLVHDTSNPEDFAVPLPTWSGTQRQARLKFTFSVAASAVTLDVAFHQVPIDGARMFVSLKSIWLALNGPAMEKQEYKAWRNNRWPSWEKWLLDDIGLAASHLRKSRDLNEAQPSHVPFPRWLFAAVSGHGLLALLSRWGTATSNTGGLLKLHAPVAQFYSEILARLPDCSLRVRADTAATWRPPDGVDTPGPIYNLLVSDGKVTNFADFMSSMRRHDASLNALNTLVMSQGCGGQILDCTSEDDGRIGLQQFLTILAGDKGAFWLLRQCIWGIGPTLERALLSRTFRKDWMREVPGVTLGLGMDQYKDSHVRNRCLAVYRRTVLSTFRAWDMLSIAFDGSRVARKPLNLFIVANHENTAAILPPQVPVEGGEERSG